MAPERHYLPAAGRDIFLPLYDPITRLLGFQEALTALVSQAALQPNHFVLDVGCGTGTLAVLVKRSHPDVRQAGGVVEGAGDRLRARARLHRLTRTLDHRPSRG